MAEHLDPMTIGAPSRPHWSDTSKLLIALIALALLLVVIIAVGVYVVGSGLAPIEDDAKIGGRSPAAPAAPVPAAEPDIDLDLLAEGPTVSADTSAEPSVDDSGTVTTFEPANLIDGKPGTAWRMDGDGTGSRITLTWDREVTISAVGLINGYAKRDPRSGQDRYPQQRRILQVTWSVGGAPAVAQELTDDTTAPQSLALPEPLVGTTLELSIDEVTEPGDRDYTAISEVLAIGR
jgi:hypothetical protein